MLGEQMATQRGDTYYVKRNFRGIGKVTRSLRTKNRTRAVARESALLSLQAQGRLDLIRAFADGTLSIEEIDEAYQSSRIDELSRCLREASADLRTAAREALRNKAPDVKSSTLERYATGLDHFLRFAGEETSVRDALTAETIQGFKAHRLEEGVKKETINNDLGAVSILATYCLSKRWISERPRFQKYTRETRIRYLEPAEIATYMAAARPQFRPLFQVSIGTGLRLGEVLNLTVSDLRLESGEMRAIVRGAKTRAGNRAVFVPPWVGDALRNLIDSRGLSGTDRLFKLVRRTVQAEHRRACRIAGISDYTLHDHRHTAAVHWAKAGTPLQLIQRQLGHANISQTMQYADFHPDYSDYGTYFSRVACNLGLDQGEDSLDFGSSSGHKLGYSAATADNSEKLATP
jgi:integrase